MSSARRGGDGSTAQWSEVARNWQFDSPLRPTQPDLALVRKALSHLSLAADRPPRFGQDSFILGQRLDIRQQTIDRHGSAIDRGQLTVGGQ